MSQQNNIQIDILGNIYNNILKGLEMGKDLIMLQGSARCFAEGTKIRMYDGSIKDVKDIVVGDKTISMDGKSYNTVIETHTGIGQLYRIHPHKSECDYLVNAEHILTIKQTEAIRIKKNGKNIALPFDKDKIIDIPVKDYIQLPKSWQRKYSLFKNTDERLSFEITQDNVGKFYGFTLDKSPYLLDYQGVTWHNSGKTYNTMIFLILRCLEKTTKVTVVRQSLPTIRNSVFQDFKTIMINMGQWEDKRCNKTELKYYFPNGSVMEFFSGDNEQKLRGPWRDILYINEANEISHYAFSMLRQRTYGFTIVDYNPSFTEEHWLFPLMKDERTYHFISTYKDNIFLPEPAIREIESYKETNPALWQIFGKGEFAIVEGLVFPKENWDIIPTEEWPSWLGEEYIGIDWGFSQDPTTFVGVILKDDHVYARELHYEIGMTTKDIAQALEPYKDNIKYCDIDNRLVTELEQAGIPLLHMTHKNAESIMSGIRILNQRHIHITADSTELIKEMRNYVYKKDRHDTYQTGLKPIDKFNHCFVGNTRIATPNGDVCISDMKAGDLVYNSKGIDIVEKVFHNGIQIVWDITLILDNGEKIKLSVTPTHKIKTTEGWIQVQDLIEGDEIFTFEGDTKQHTLKSIEITEKYYTLTYNLMIKDVHEYFANGILVSNCIDSLRYVCYAELGGDSDERTIFSKDELGLFM